MKKTQVKDALRNILKQIVSFFSILIVVALGVGIFLACNFGAQAVEERTNAFYRETSFRDFEIKANRGITDEDVSEVKNLPGVIDAVGVINIELVADTGTDKAIVRGVSLTDGMDEPVIVEGRLPENRQECAVEVKILEDLGLQVGDELKLSPTAGEDSPSLYDSAVRITGAVIHPEHTQADDVVDHNVLLTPDAFNMESAGVPWTGILLRADMDANTFSQQYLEDTDEMLLSLASLGRERAKIRDDSIIDDAEAKISEKEEELAEGREQLAEGRKKLDDGQKELQEGTAKLDEARSELDSAKTQLAEGESQLAHARTELGKARSQLDAAKVKLDDGKKQLDEGKKQLDNGKKQLDEAKEKLDEAAQTIKEKKKELRQAEKKLENARQKLDEAEGKINDGVDLAQDAINELASKHGWEPVPQLSEVFPLDYTKHADELLHDLLSRRWSGDQLAEIESLIQKSKAWKKLQKLYDQIPDGEAQYAEGKAQYDEGKAALEAGEAEYEEKLAEYKEGKQTWNKANKEYQKKKAEYDKGYAEYTKGLKEYEASQKKYEDGLKAQEEAEKKIASGEQELKDKQQELESGKAELAEGEKEWEEKESEAESGAAAIEEAKQKLNDYEPGNWILMDRTLNLSWHEANEDCRAFRSIGLAFALLFILLGVLVCYATIGKIIDEQRVLVGTTKALGFTRGEVFRKYLLFGGLSSVFGCIAGLILSYFVLEKIMLDKIEKMYMLGTVPKCFVPWAGAASVVVGIVVAVLATWAACRKLLSEPATRLLSGNVPDERMGKKKGAGKSARSLYSSLILRNMRTDLKRVIITIVSVAGCCMLLVIGFSMKFSFDNVIQKEFEEIIRYDAVVRFLKGEDDSAESVIGNLLQEKGTESVPVISFGTVVRTGEMRELVEVFCASPEEMQECYDLTDEKTSEKITVPDRGVLIFNRLAEVYDLHEGDQLMICDEGGKWHETEIAGIYHNYTGRTILLSKDYAEEVFEGKEKVNAFAVMLGSAGETEVKQALEKEDSFLQYTSSEESRVKYQRIAEALNTVILVMILMAGIMAAVVLLNLVRIQINQKKRELTVMRVNGFTTGETVAYILRENILTTAIGIGLGLVVGILTASYNLHAVERVEIQMMRSPSLPACLYSALITVGFAAIVNFIALRRIRNLNLRDVND